MLCILCCASCFIPVHKRLIAERHRITGFWYNPNIHPFMEYRARLEALIKYRGIEEIEIIYRDEYDLKEFLQAQINAENRCEFCYNQRLTGTAKTAKGKNFDAFTTTLLGSPFQKHDLIKNLGESIGKENNIKFYYEDFRKWHEQGKKEASSLSLYRQRYCGCIFSEKERFGRKIVG
jgi:predicted adenine nucleotide alpha hydrolase (AANH) superfamily ATPase